MGNRSNVSPDEIRAAYAEMLPFERDRRLLCQLLLKSVAYCEEAGSRGWSVSLLPRGFRLSVGQVDALTCSYHAWDKRTFELSADVGFVDFRFLVSGPDVQRSLADFDPGLVTRMNYRSVPEPHWSVMIPLYVEGPGAEAGCGRAMREFEAVQPCHRHFVASAARSRSGAPRQRSHFARFHCEGLMAYARNVVAGYRSK